jgi:hypothetical protein
MHWNSDRNTRRADPIGAKQGLLRPLSPFQYHAQRHQHLTCPSFPGIRPGLESLNARVHLHPELDRD